MTGRDAADLMFTPAPLPAPAGAGAGEFDGIVTLAATLCDTPVAFVCIRAEGKFSLQAVAGPLPLGALDGRVIETLAGDDGDVRELHEPLNPGMPEALRFVAGASLFDPHGRRLGLLGVADHVARRLLPAQSRALQSLARQVGALFGLGQAADADVLAGREAVLAAWRLAESDQRRRARLFAATADLAQEAMVLVDPESGRFVEFNSAAHRSLGYERAEFARLSLSDIDAGLSPGTVKEAFARLASGDMRTFGARHRTRGGHLRDVSVTRRLIEVEGHRYVCAVWSVDAGQEETSAASVEQLMRDLDVLNQTIAHDLRSPLHRIAGFAGLLSYEDKIAEDPMLLDYTGRITSAAQKMERLISRLVEYMRLGRVVPARRETGLDSVVAECVADSMARQESGTVQWALQPLPTVWADPRLLRIVVENLVDNAVKFSSKRMPPEIAIDPLRTPDGEGFSIRDNGAGFDMGYAEKLLQVGSRLHAEVDFPGTGIGLAIVRRVLEKHGGRIWFESEVERGAVFHVCFPARRVLQGTA